MQIIILINQMVNLKQRLPLSKQTCVSIDTWLYDYAFDLSFLPCICLSCLIKLCVSLGHLNFFLEEVWAEINRFIKIHCIWEALVSGADGGITQSSVGCSEQVHKRKGFPCEETWMKTDGWPTWEDRRFLRSIWSLNLFFSGINIGLISEEEMSKQSDIFLILCHFSDNLWVDQ